MQLVPVIEIRRGKVVQLASKNKAPGQIANRDLLQLVEQFAVDSNQPAFELERLACQLESDGVVGLVVLMSGESMSRGSMSRESISRGSMSRESISRDSAECQPGEKEEEKLLEESIFERLPDSINLPVFANGFISHLSDLEHLLESSARFLSGVLIRNTGYNGCFSLEEANQLIKRYQN